MSFPQLLTFSRTTPGWHDAATLATRDANKTLIELGIKATEVRSMQTADTILVIDGCPYRTYTITLLIASDNPVLINKIRSFDAHVSPMLTGGDHA